MQVPITQAIVDALKQVHDVPDTLRRRFDGITPAKGGFVLVLDDDDATTLAELVQWHIKSDEATGKITPASVPFDDLIRRIDQAQFE